MADEVAARLSGSGPPAALQVPKPAEGRPPTADPLRQLDDDPLRAADVTEPIAVLVACQLANELRAAGSQAGNDGVDVVDCECEMADARGVRRRVLVGARFRRGMELRIWTLRAVRVSAAPACRCKTTA
ncbi:MAG TPA: hypothetical protein VGD00_03815 [Solirubrobacteraceae bacterium]|jgi:hypothetical protein